MIDYLELLLDEQEREGSEEGAELEFGSPNYLGARTGGGGAAAAPQGVKTEQATAEDRMDAETAQVTAGGSAGVSAVGFAGIVSDARIRNGAEATAGASAREAVEGSSGAMVRNAGGEGVGAAVERASWTADSEQIEDRVEDAIEARTETARAETDQVAGLLSRPVLARTVRIRDAGSGAVWSDVARSGETRRVGSGDQINETETGVESTEGGSLSPGRTAVESGGGQAALWSVLRRGQRGALSAGGEYADAGGTAGLYRQMVRAGQAVGGLRQSARVLTAAESAAPAAAPGAAELDEIFARDARRYDSGFSLY